MKLPVYTWLADYNRSWIRGDVVAGLTVWAVLVPEALAYATIAGVRRSSGSTRRRVRCSSMRRSAAHATSSSGRWPRPRRSRRRPSATWVREILATEQAPTAIEIYPSVRAAVDALGTADIATEATR